MGMDAADPKIAVLGASGLIGEAVSAHLMSGGFTVVPVARRFTRSQERGFGPLAAEVPVVDLTEAGLAALLADNAVDIVVNCIGVLQDGPRGSTEDVHRGFVDRLIAAIRSQSRPVLLIHVSIPGSRDSDRTAFSRTKRDAERLIAGQKAPYIILRPGFVVAPAAFGASALIRALSMLPTNLPAQDLNRPFAATAIADIGRTVAVVARRWQGGRKGWAETWEVVERTPSTLGDVVGAFRRRLGGPEPRIILPSWLLAAGSRAGDLVAHLGWSAPVRTTALQEMRRGVSGDPEPWIGATGLEPASLDRIVEALPNTVQERWFARLYLAKPLIIAILAVFWCVSGLIALTVAFGAATAILTAQGIPGGLAQAITIASSLADLAIGLAISFRRTCRAGLAAGIGVSLFYMVGAAVITPDMWIEPLGALVKAFPAIVLMIVALATLDER